MPDPPELALAVLEKVRLSLVHATTFDDIKLIRDKAEAARKYAQSAAMGLQIQNMAAELKLRAERKAGTLLTELALRGGDRKSNSHRESLKLDDLGINHNQSARWQREARIPEKVFEEYVGAANQASTEITAEGLLRLAKQVGNRQSPSAKVASGSSGLTKEVDQEEPNPPTNYEEMVADLVAELQNRQGLLGKILTPHCDGRQASLKPIDRKELVFDPKR